ncbi:MAG: NUDIX hydrolase [Solobacterium sp.]|nr:NUDIX hydrolase [Solobacterium sp.]MBQ6532121.1 NUDIX hydrolase [Solobacterium sp.]MBR0213379.1 NUDIX hydrolase [Solobacterium sp.]
MELIEKTCSRRLRYEGPVVKVYEDDALMPSGNHALRVVVDHPGGVAVAMEDEEGRFFVVTQWRYAQRCLMIEYPAGKREEGEDPVTTAAREIREETGYEGVDFRYLGKMVPTGAYDSEIIHMYACRKGAYTGQQLDKDEYLEVASMSLDELRDAVMDGGITDAKTIVMTFKLIELKKQEEKK